jgi:hypothetical protein
VIQDPSTNKTHSPAGRRPRTRIDSRLAWPHSELYARRVRRFRVEVTVMYNYERQFNTSHMASEFSIHVVLYNMFNIYFWVGCIKRLELSNKLLRKSPYSLHVWDGAWDRTILFEVEM